MQTCIIIASLDRRDSVHSTLLNIVDENQSYKYYLSDGWPAGNFWQIIHYAWATKQWTQTVTCLNLGMFELAEETLHTDYSARLPNSDDMDVVETLRAVTEHGLVEQQPYCFFVHVGKAYSLPYQFLDACFFIHWVSYNSNRFLTLSLNMHSSWLARTRFLAHKNTNRDIGNFPFWSCKYVPCQEKYPRKAEGYVLCPVFECFRRLPVVACLM